VFRVASSLKVGGGHVMRCLSVAKEGVFPITDKCMTRFMITLEEGVELVWRAIDDMVGGEIYVKKIPSMKVTDVANAISSKAKQEVIGIRPGEKLHEQMIGVEDASYTYEYDDYYKILPVINNWSSDPMRINNGKKVKEGFIYSSDTNVDWMSVKTLSDWIIKNKNKIGNI
jgi:FlaA1/EpsC-like NDP-sugar epimerase